MWYIYERILFFLSIAVWYDFSSDEWLTILTCYCVVFSQATYSFKMYTTSQIKNIVSLSHTRHKQACMLQAKFDLWMCKEPTDKTCHRSKSVEQNLIHKRQQINNMIV